MAWALVGHEVDHVPMLQGGRVEEATGHDQLLGTARAGPFGQSLRTAHRWRQPDHDLDQAELRRFSGDDDVAGEREFERGGEGEAVGGEDHGQRQVLDAFNQPEKVGPEGRTFSRTEALELFYVDAAGDDFAFGPDQQRSWGIDLKRGDRFL